MPESWQYPGIRNLLPLLLLALFIRGHRAAAQPPAAELLRNGAFEGGAGSDGKGAGVPRWDALDSGYDVDRQVRHLGDQSIRCDNLRPTGRRGARCRLELNQTQAAPILLSGWSKADAVNGSPDSDYSLYVDILYTDGTPLWGQFAPFRTGTHDWERKRLSIFPARPIRTLTVYALFRSHSGTAWFDDFSAHTLQGDGIFDGQVLQLPPRPDAAGKSVSVSARNGLSLTIGPQADIKQVKLGVQGVSGPASGGFYLRDVAKDRPPVAARGAARQYHGTGFDFFSSPPGADVRFYARIVPDGDSLSVDGELTDLTGSDRAVTVYLALPIDALNWRWGQDIRHEPLVDAHHEYANLTRVNVGATGGLSLYPFGCVTSGDKGVGVSSQMDWPSICRIFYNGPARQLVLAWDFALTGKTAAWPSHNARFRCSLFRLAPDTAHWGFRAAARRFYALNSPNFERRAKAEGIWLPFTKPSTVEHPEDFGFAYHEGDSSVAADDRAGILSFRYTEPSTWWMSMPPAMPRTYEAALAEAKRLSESVDPKQADQRTMARALFNSGTQDASGRFNLEFRNEPWANGAVFILNPNPELPSAPERPTRASIAYTVADAIKRYGPVSAAASGALDGEYLDSLEYWSDTLDYRPASLQASPYPIPFETDSFAPVVPQWYSTHTFTRFLRDDLHNRGRLLMANTVPIRFSIFAPLLDVMGIEGNWLNSAGVWSPDSDETMSMRRTLSYQRPYLLLQNTNFDRFGPDLVEKYFQRCLFYGIYPSMFSADAANNPYWDTPKWYNRDRPLFKAYIPVIKRLSAAGWEPVTWARSDNPGVYLERYGLRLFTVLNDTTAKQQAQISIDSQRLNLATAAMKAVNVRTDAEIPLRITDRTATISVSLEPGESAAIELR